MALLHLVALALLALPCILAIQLGGGVLVMPLELVQKNGSHSSAGRRLLGSARMNLHDDLLTKGYYTSRVSIGTPAHEFALIVDTGSTVTYVPCSSCTHCGNHQDPRFSPSSSASYKPLECGGECRTGTCQGDRCSYKRTYAEMSSSSGMLGKDLLSFSNTSSIGSQELVFGCETSETGDLYDQTADGIMGLGRGPLSVVDQLVEKHAMEDVFSLCYGGMSFGGGAMVLGASASHQDMVFTRSDPQRSPYYNIMLKGLRVAGVPLDLKPEVFNGNHGTVLDSGTTYAYFPGAAFESFKEAVKQHLAEGLQEVAGPDPNFKDICYAGAGTDISKLSEFFPSLELVFENAGSVALTPENYLFRHTKVSGAYCLGVFKNADTTTLLGGIIVRNMLVSYDRARERIGFMKTNCSNLWNMFTGPSQHSQQPAQLFSPPPAVAPSPSPELSRDYPAVEITMVLATSYSTFSNLTMEFIEDVVRDLGVDLTQVSILNFTAVGSDNITVNWVVYPENITVERIISRLEHHEVHLSEVFGMYKVTSFRVVPVNTTTSEEEGNKNKIMVLGARVVMAAAFVAVVISAVGAAVYWQLRFRHAKHSYQTLDESSSNLMNGDEEQPLQQQAHGVQLQQL